MTENKTNETPRITKYDCALDCAIWLQDIIPSVLDREKCLTPEYRFPLPLSKTHTLFVTLVIKTAVFDKTDVEFIDSSTSVSLSIGKTSISTGSLRALPGYTTTFRNIIVKSIKITL